jgi:hypothetical protein
MQQELDETRKTVRVRKDLDWEVVRRRLSPSRMNAGKRRRRRPRRRPPARCCLRVTCLRVTLPFPQVTLKPPNSCPRENGRAQRGGAGRWRQVLQQGRPQPLSSQLMLRLLRRPCSCGRASGDIQALPAAAPPPP